MATSQRKRQSNNRYHAKCDPIQIRPLKATGAAIRAAAAAAGQSLQSYVVQAVQERMTREGQPLQLPVDNDEAEQNHP